MRFIKWKGVATIEAMTYLCDGRALEKDGTLC